MAERCEAVEQWYGIHSEARHSARMHALWRMHQMVLPGRWLSLDAETTGLGLFDQVVEVSVCDPDLNVSTWRIQPTIPMTEEATAIHGITGDDLEDALSFAEIWPQIEEHIAGRLTVMWNAEFDTSWLRASARAHRMRARIDGRWCAMLSFAAFYGQKNGCGEL